MRKIILNIMVSLDGYIEGPNQDLGWHRVDDEWNAYAIELMQQVDTILFGRVAYQLFERYWPAAAKDPKTSKDDLFIANWIDSAQKIVFSRTLQNVQWKNTTLLHEVIPEEIEKMKRQPGKDMVMYGGAAIAQSFMNLNLIDQYRLFVNPVVLGAGKPLFKNREDKMNLNLINTKVFKSGLVGLYYEPVK